VKVLIVGLATFDQMAGGSARYLSGQADGLRDLGHAVVLRTSAEHVRAVGYTERGLAGQLRRVAQRLLITMPHTVRTVWGDRPDVINVHFALDGLPAVAVAAFSRRPVVVTFHGPWALEAQATGRRGRWPFSTMVRHRIERLVYTRAARCIVLSDSFADVLAGTYGVQRDVIRTIPGGLDTSRFGNLPSRAGAKQRLGWPDEFTIVSVRRLVPRMGLDLAIDALARLRRIPGARLVIAGTGPERSALVRLAGERAVSDRVSFVGRIEDDVLPLVYRAADACIVPSRELEGFGYVALEALAAGTPVIATGTGGLGELVAGIEPRWVVPPDAEAAAEAVAALYSDRAAFPDDAACTAYAATMDWSRITPRIVAVFREAVDDRRGR
jgi:glycosyltransferase involved in cell wall biosynthesis